MYLKDFTRTAIPGHVFAISPARAAGGMTGSTLIETTSGWCPASDLRIGQRVHTLDGGAALILGLDRRPVNQMPAITLPGGVADTCSDLTLPLDQYILTDTLGDAVLDGLDMVLVPATAWADHPGVTRSMLTGEVITPMFGDEEIVWANSGALLHCPSVATGPGRLPLDGFFTALPDADARAFLARRAARLCA